MLDQFQFVAGIHALWYFDNKIFASDLKNIYVFNKIIISDTNERGYKLINSQNIPKGPIRVEFVELQGKLQFHAAYSKGRYFRAEYLEEVV